jgi:DNA polymerase
MRSVLFALTDELKRLKTEGVKTVSVSDESLATLRRVVAARRQPGDGGPEAGNEGAPDFTMANEVDSSRIPPEPHPVAAFAPKPVASLRSPVSDLPDRLPTPPEVVLPAGDKPARWQALRELVLNHPVCRAHVRPGKQVVFGVGNLDAKIMFVGEAPGADEEEQGEPFVGPAGQLLTKMIKAMGRERGDVYIGNIMNWRPERPLRSDGTQVGNREPTPEEMAFCLPFITAQIEVVDPALLVALGATAARGLLGAPNVRTLGAARGSWHDYRGRPLRVTYHPSYLLRKEEDGLVAAKRAKRAAWEDFLAVMERVGLPISEKQRNFFLA